MLEHSAYHSVLRMCALSLALVLLFDSGLISPVTQQLSQGAQQYVASAIGVRATVSPTDLNQLTAELTQQRQAVAEREAAVIEREIAVGRIESGESSTNSLSTILLSSVLFILLILIVLNYILDFLRANRVDTNPRVVT